MIAIENNAVTQQSKMIIENNVNGIKAGSSLWEIAVCHGRNIWYQRSLLKEMETEMLENETKSFVYVG